MRMTADLLSALGSCGGYVQTFTQLFPRDEFPDGVEVTVETCTKYADQFDWAWASETMLVANARERWSDEVYYKGPTAKAQMFAEMFEDPANRQDRMATLQERVDRNASDREKTELDALERTVTEARARVEQLPELEERLVERREAYRTNESARLVRRVERAATKVAEAEAAHAKLEAELSALVATDDTGSDDTSDELAVSTSN